MEENSLLNFHNRRTTLPSVHLVPKHMVHTFISHIDFMQNKHLSEKSAAVQSPPYIQYARINWTSQPPILSGSPRSLSWYYYINRKGSSKTTLSQLFSFTLSSFLKGWWWRISWASTFVCFSPWTRFTYEKKTHTIKALWGLVPKKCCFLQNFFVCFLFLKLNHKRRMT